VEIKINRVALYARVSGKLNSKRERDKIETSKREQDTENQLRQLRGYCSSQNWEVVKEYVDRGSGKSGERDEFKRMFQDAYERKFDLVLFWSLDRFSREGVLETLQYLQKLTSWKVEWKSFSEQYLDSCGVFRDAVLAILATIAKQERIRIIERTVAGLDRARAEGKEIGRPKRIVNIDTILSLRREGDSVKTISAKLGVSKNTIDRRIQEYVKRNNIQKIEKEVDLAIDEFEEV